MSCTGELVLGVEEGLFLLPSDLFSEIFLPLPQSYRGGDRWYDRKPRMWYAVHRSTEKPSDAGAGRVKPRGTGVFLPERPATSIQEKKKTCPIISSRSRQIFLPKDWAY